MLQLAQDRLPSREALYISTEAMAFLLKMPTAKGPGHS